MKRAVGDVRILDRDHAGRGIADDAKRVNVVPAVTGSAARGLKHAQALERAEILLILGPAGRALHGDEVMTTYSTPWSFNKRSRLSLSTVDQRPGDSVRFDEHHGQAFLEGQPEQVPDLEVELPFLVVFAELEDGHEISLAESRLAGELVTME